MANGPDEKLSRLGKAGREFAAGATGGLVGALAGGPAGAPIGAAATVLTGQAFDALNGLLSRRRNRVLQPAIDVVGEAKLAERLLNEPRLGPLTLKAADLAARTEWDAHVDALAAVLRDGVLAIHDPDETGQLLNAVGTITPDGIMLLRHLLYDVPDGGHGHFIDTEMSGRFSWSRSRVRTALRGLEDGGAVETVGSLLGGGEGWKPLGLAHTVMEYLRAAGAAPPSEAPPTETQ